MQTVTPKMAEVVTALATHGSVQVRGLTGIHRDKHGKVIKRTQDRAVMRLFLERETQRSVSLLQLGETAIYSFN